jgi:DNA-binding phage protein
MVPENFGGCASNPATKAAGFATIVIMKVKKRALLRIEDVIRILRDEVEQAGDQSKWARKVGVERSGLNLALWGKKSPPKAILKVLKLRKVIAFERDDSE